MTDTDNVPEIIDSPTSAPGVPPPTSLEPEMITEHPVMAETAPTTPPSEPTITSESVPEEATPENITPKSLQPTTTEETPPASPPPRAKSSRKGGIFILIGSIFFFVLVFFIVYKVFGIFKGSNDPVTIEYWGLWDEKSSFDPLIAEYQKEHDNVIINYQKRDPNNYREKLLTQSADGKGPDIFRYHSTWLSSIADVASPMPEEIEKNMNFDATFYEVANKDLTIENRKYGVPLMVDSLVLVYNKDLLRRVGIELDPKTWDDILDYSSRLTIRDSDGAIVTAGIALGTADNIEHFSDIFGWMLIQNGASLDKLDSPEAVDTLVQYRKFAEAPGNFWSPSMPNSISAFSQGRVAMIFVPSWQILSINQANPELEIGVAALPLVPEGSDAALANYWVEGVSKYSKNQEEAWKFLEFLSTKESQTKRYSEQAKTRLFGEPYSRVDLRDALQDNIYIGPVVGQGPKLKSWPVIDRTYDNGINDQINAYLRDAINSTINGVDYEEAMNTAAKGINTVLDKYKL